VADTIDALVSGLGEVVDACGGSVPSTVTALVAMSLTARSRRRPSHDATGCGRT
jgi:hypothetical protein